MRSLLAVLGLFMLNAGQVQSGFVNYANIGSFTTSGSIISGGVTATETLGGTLSVTSGNGLGVVGGINLGVAIIDSSESVRFTFDNGPVTAVSFETVLIVAADINPNFNLEGFGGSGGSLGVVTLLIDSFAHFSTNISGAFGDVPLSGFRFFGNGTITGLPVTSIRFTESAPTTTVPLPPTIGMVALGAVVAITGSQVRRRRGVCTVG